MRYERKVNLDRHKEEGVEEEIFWELREGSLGYALGRSFESGVIGYRS